MLILNIIIIILSVLIILLLLKLRNDKKLALNDYDNELMLFVIEMYLSYGETLDIFPNDEAKKVLIDKINELKNKIDLINQKNIKNK